jgi:two-component system response regulator DesR
VRQAITGYRSSGLAAELDHVREALAVRNYLSEAIAKLRVTNRIEAARLARQRGWL